MCAKKRKDRQALKTSETVSFRSFLLLILLLMPSLGGFYMVQIFYNTCYITLIGFHFFDLRNLILLSSKCPKPNLSFLHLHNPNFSKAEENY